ncbi:hypothetical protein [Actinosynnema mirum]|uniref:Uncharacterized protein n=1 Tax=Actinosynnema mirum (strain ATCC 29888 / DSM 43827 / JCM 3225 / NBRC 14064 / NCIMB 13271 / NRRL B-12336 / IMRU 3971 / 101) TaxID=446462 RepID=C6WBA8_ACTMD|nr:hypothetical protein [Actinosynnema mirum]ACU39399.1 hypothetical protein Amir_5581 [Actinosynnema mirum DSM 43827]
MSAMDEIRKGVAALGATTTDDERAVVRAALLHLGGQALRMTRDPAERKEIAAVVDRARGTERPAS